jgi:hypothetical protein
MCVSHLWHHCPTYCLLSQSFRLCILLQGCIQHTNEILVNNCEQVCWNCNTFSFYLGVRFESQMGHRLSWLRSLLVSSITVDRWWDNTLNLTKTACFSTLYDSLFHIIHLFGIKCSELLTTMINEAQMLARYIEKFSDFISICLLCTVLLTTLLSLSGASCFIFWRLHA